MTGETLRGDDPLNDFTPKSFTLLDKTRRVWVSGAGPAVIVMTEMPGISPHVARFARWVREAGFTVYMPHLYGKDGASPVTAVASAQRSCGNAYRAGRACRGQGADGS